MYATVNSILEHKGRDVLTIERTETVYEAIRRMVDRNVGSIVVTDQHAHGDGEKVCGIFTERDYMKKIILEGRSSKTTPVDQVMSPEVAIVDPEYDVEECMAIMTRERCRHLPVVEDNKVVGIISIGDCVKQVSRDARARVKYLTDYIKGKYPQ